uniref:Uncharacterized protein n=1 Tax=Oryza brachyantha TaxID=4533 RepID=J3MFG7_ORYBR
MLASYIVGGFSAARLLTLYSSHLPWRQPCPRSRFFPSYILCLYFVPNLLGSFYFYYSKYLIDLYVMQCSGTTAQAIFFLLLCNIFYASLCPNDRKLINNKTLTFQPSVSNSVSFAENI